MADGKELIGVQKLTSLSRASVWSLSVKWNSFTGIIFNHWKVIRCTGRPLQPPPPGVSSRTEKQL